jgi:hypothetical protein
VGGSGSSGQCRACGLSDDGDDVDELLAYLLFGYSKDPFVHHVGVLTAVVLSKSSLRRRVAKDMYI